MNFSLYIPRLILICTGVFGGLAFVLAAWTLRRGLLFRQRKKKGTGHSGRAWRCAARSMENDSAPDEHGDRHGRLPGNPLRNHRQPPCPFATLWNSSRGMDCVSCRRSHYGRDDRAHSVFRRAAVDARRSDGIRSSRLSHVTRQSEPRGLIWKMALDFAQNQTARDHVVNGLLFLGEASKDVTDRKRNQASDEFGKVTSRRPGKRNRLSGHVCHR